MHRPRVAAIATSILLFSAFSHTAYPSCTEGPGDCCPNVGWVVKDSIAACPAGDSLLFSHPSQHSHPAKLRMTVYYTDSNCDPRAGVPAESIWVATDNYTGNLKLNGDPGVVFADGPTDNGGLTRITISGFSGAGTLRVRLFVSGEDEGAKNIVVRTVDADADWIVSNPADSVAMGTSAIDVTYAGGVDSTDRG